MKPRAQLVVAEGTLVCPLQPTPDEQPVVAAQLPQLPVHDYNLALGGTVLHPWFRGDAFLPRGPTTVVVPQPTPCHCRHGMAP